MCKLICMSFDGDYVTERPDFETVEDAWEHDNDLGSKWYFYPFHFVTTASGKTIKDAPDDLDQFEGMRVRSVSRIFEKASQLPEAQNMEPDQFCALLWDKAGVQ